MGRLNYHSSYIDHQGFWQMNGYGLLAVYKSDWIRFGGKFKVNLTAEERNVPLNFFLGGGAGGSATQRTELQILSYQTIKCNFF